MNDTKETIKFIGGIIYKLAIAIAALLTIYFYNLDKDNSGLSGMLWVWFWLQIVVSALALFDLSREGQKPFKGLKRNVCNRGIFNSKMGFMLSIIQGMALAYVGFTATAILYLIIKFLFTCGVTDGYSKRLKELNEADEKKEGGAP